MATVVPKGDSGIFISPLNKVTVIPMALFTDSALSLTFFLFNNYIKLCENNVSYFSKEKFVTDETYVFLSYPIRYKFHNITMMRSRNININPVVINL